MHIIGDAFLSLLGAMALWLLDRVMGGMFGSPIDRLTNWLKDWWASRSEQALRDRIQSLRLKLERTAGREMHPGQAVIVGLLMVLLLQVTTVIVLLSASTSLIAEILANSQVLKIPPGVVHQIELTLLFAAVVSIFLFAYFAVLTYRFQWRTRNKRFDVARTIEKLEAKLKERELKQTV